MRKPESRGSRIAIGLAVAAGAGGIALLAAGSDDTAEPKLTERYVDCAVNPGDTVSTTIHPGEVGQANLGEAYKKNGRTIWRSLIEVHYGPDKFTVVAGGFSPPGGTIKYDQIPGGDSKHDAFVENRVYPGFLDATVRGFDARDPMSPDNEITFTYHCGPPPEPLPNGGPPTSSSSAGAPKA